MQCVRLRASVLTHMWACLCVVIPLFADYVRQLVPAGALPPLDKSLVRGALPSADTCRCVRMCCRCVEHRFVSVPLRLHCSRACGWLLQAEHANLTLPHEWYPLARQIKRKIIVHVGPTNSGKVM